MFDKVMKHKGFFGVTLCGIGVFASSLLHLTEATSFFEVLGGGLLFALCVGYALENF